ncbi:MAG: hypothetical protein V3T30_02165, partial [Thermodesulfobacteriota bacterium]
MFRRPYRAAALLFMAFFFSATNVFASYGVADPEEEGHHLWDVKDPVDGFHHLWEEMLIDIVIIGVIFSLVTIYLLIKYRRKRADQEGSPPKLSTAQKMGWVLIPVFIFLADDLFLAAEGWTLWNKYRTVPE